MKFLVTGGCGFIGSHLCEALLRDGYKVRILDDLSTGKASQAPSGTDLVVGDVSDPSLVAEALGGVSGCFHLAAVASVERGREDWLGTHRTNLTGTVTVLDAIRRAGDPIPFVYASSAAVYGDASVLPLGEDTLTRPLSAYGADKLGSELHARAGGATHGILSCGLRFFNVYGPRQDPASPYSGVVSRFCDCLLQGRPVTVHGDGGQTRDFVYVTDVVQALLAAMWRTRTSAPVYNVCTGRETSVLDLLHTVADVLGVTPNFSFAQPRPGDLRRSLGNPQRARRELGVQASTTLAQGLEATLAE